MRVVSLGSGSSGNALLVEGGPGGRTKLLIDAGLSGSMMCERLHQVGVHPGQLQGVLVTHEHSDHISGLPVLMKRYATPVIADPRTYQVIADSMAAGVWRTNSGTLLSTRSASDPSVSVPQEAIEQVGVGIVRSAEDTKWMIALPVGTRRIIGDIAVTSFPTSHDAVAPCGYLLSVGGCRVCLVTDSGEVTPVMLDVIRQADLLVLEANYDRERLLNGPYPHFLKQRVLGATGHLSNTQAANAILQTWRSDSVRWLWLAHISRTNNTPELALKSIRSRLHAAGANLAQVHLSALPPTLGSVWDSTQLWHVPSLWEMGL